MLRIFGVYADLSPVDCLSARAERELLAVLVCEKRSGLRHSISDCKRKTYLAEPLLDFRIQRCTAHDEHLNLASESVEKLLSDLLADD